MKKSLAILGMITCMVGLTACGSSKAVDTPLVSEDQAKEVGESIVESMNQVVMQGLEAQYATDPVFGPALESWVAAQEEMGSYAGIIETTTEITADKAVISVKVDGTDHDAVVELIVDDTLNFSSITTTVTKTFGEMMTNAFLNTVIGMGTVFVVLVLISLIISLFGLIPKIQEGFKKKESVQEQAVDNALAQIIEKEEQSDDLELVAVIAAAIAASEGAASADDFIVRSIRKVNRR